jgi:prepilin-type N-terminal cleavage/methylation domain-containing protein
VERRGPLTTIRLADERGVTLMELVVTLIIAGIVIAALIGSVENTRRLGHEVHERSVPTGRR